MKAYLITTAAVFGLVTVAHVWRMLAEGARMATDPFFLALTVATAVLCVWGCRLLRKVSRSPH